MEAREALRLARTLLREHGLEDWQVTLDRAKTRAGSCRFHTRTITLSRALTELHSEAEVRETILHEIAHALVGPEHGHDAIWRAQAKKIGSTGARCVDPRAPRVRADWQGRCPAGHSTGRHRAPTAPMSCARCSPTFSAAHLIEWTYRGSPASMPPEYSAAMAQLRRRRLPERGHWRPQLGEQVLLTRADGSEVVGVVELVGLGGIQARIEGIGLVKVGWEIVAPAQKRVG